MISPDHCLLPYPLDELGTLPSKTSVRLALHLLNRIYEHTTVGITTNRSDAEVTTAPLDRLDYRCHIVETGNDSPPLRASSAAAAGKNKEANCP